MTGEEKELRRKRWTRGSNVRAAERVVLHREKNADIHPSGGSRWFLSYHFKLILYDVTGTKKNLSSNIHVPSLRNTTTLITPVCLKACRDRGVVNFSRATAELCAIRPNHPLLILVQRSTYF